MLIEEKRFRSQVLCVYLVLTLEYVSNLGHSG